MAVENRLVLPLAQNLRQRYSVHPILGLRTGGGPMQLRLSTRIVDGIAVLDCAGRIVFGDESSLLRDTAKKMINENKRIVLNLSGVSYIDSGGLGTLGLLFTSAQEDRGFVK